MACCVRMCCGAVARCASFDANVFENRGLREIFGPKRDEVVGVGEHYIMRSLMI